MTLLAGAWPAILGLVVGAIGILTAMFKHQQLQTAKAEITAVKAQSDSQASDTLRNAVLASQQADQAAQQQVADKATERTQIDAQVAAQSDDEVQNELQNQYGR